MHRLRRRILRRKLIAMSSYSSLTSLLPFRAPSVQALVTTTNQNSSLISLNSEFGAPILLHSTVPFTTLSADEGLNLKCEFVGRPPAFCPGNGVAEVLGVSKLNILLKRTQQEATDGLIYAGRCRQVGEYAWANLLFSEAYSLWFLLLPSFLTSLHHQLTKGQLENPTVLCSESRNLLTHAITLFLRLHQLPLHFTDQVSVRVLLALLYEYARSDKGITNFWQSCVLNATSYAMANQLQRDLGLKLAASENKETVEVVPQDASLIHGDLPLDAERYLLPQALSTPRASRLTNGNAEENLNGRENFSLIVGVDSSDNLLPTDEEATCTNSDASPFPTQKNEGNDNLKSLPISKKGWRNFTMKSIKSIASISVNWEEPKVVNMTTSFSAVALNPKLDNIQKPSNQRQTKSIGYTHLFNKPVRQIRDDDEFRESRFNPTLMSGETEEPASSNSSWIQGLRSEISRKLISMSPAPQRHTRNGSDGVVAPPWTTRRPSVTLVEEVGSGLPVVTTSLINGGSFDQPDGPPSCSWHEIAGSLAVGSLSDRMCLANFFLASSATNDGNPGSQLRSRFSCSAGRKMRHNRRSNSFSSSPVAIPTAGIVDNASRQRTLLAASSPLLSAIPRLKHPSYSSVEAKPPLPSASATSSFSTFPRQCPPRVAAASSSFTQPPRALELRVILTTCSTCPGCLRLVYDEEVMSEWVHCENNETVIRCPYCPQRHEFTPKLTVRVVAIGELAAATNELASSQCCRSPSPGAGNQKVPFSHGLIEYSLAYLNPFLLRKELEAFLTPSSSSASTSDCMAVESLSSASLLSGSRHDTLLWNLVLLFHRIGLPTHLLDAYPAWLMDCQAEVRRLGPSNNRRCLKGITITKALFDIILSPDLPVWLVAKWDMFPRKGAHTQPLHCLWARQVGNGGESVANESVDSECAPDEVVRMAGDALKFNITEAAFRAVLTQRRSGGGAHQPEDTKGSLSSLLQTPVSRFSPEASLYRELFLLFIRIHGVDNAKINEFENDYRRLYNELLKSESDRLSQADAPPSTTTLACRALFRNLTLN